MLGLAVVLAHLVGDYLLQTDWMAKEKTKRWWPAVAHGLTYSVPYAALMLLGVTRFSVPALLVIGGTHIVLDRFRLARHVVWFKNQFAPRAFRSRWEDCRTTGYPPENPAFMSVWLMIIADNTIHLAINAASVVWL